MGSDTQSIQLKNGEVEQKILAIDKADDSMHRILEDEILGSPQKQLLLDLLKEVSANATYTPLPRFENEEQMAQYDSILASEGITRPDITFPNIGESASDQEEYRGKIAHLRGIYLEEMAAYEKACQDFKEPVLSVLEQQATLRPVSSREKELVLASIDQRFLGIQLQIKESICQAVLLIKNKIFETRRKRRKYVKTANAYLNEAFYKNLPDPRPTDQLKEELAAKCSLTTTQVTNWFANKRLRYDSGLIRTDEQLKELEEVLSLENNNNIAIDPSSEPMQIPSTHH